MTTSEKQNAANVRLCPCCGSSVEQDKLKGSYNLGPYRFVCEKCWSNPFLDFPDKTIRKDGLSYPPKKNDIINPEPKVWKGPPNEGKMNVLLVEPNYYTRYPPLGLLKLSAFHKLRGDQVTLVRFPEKPKDKPNIIYVTSLFTYSWKKVHEAVRFYKKLFPETELVLGGVYASLLPHHAMSSGSDCLWIGLIEELENLKPDYTVPIAARWDSNIIFSSRGCIRQCGFCAVPRLEGGISSKNTIMDLIDHRLKRVTLWDNNILATLNWSKIFDELEELEYEIDFNQGFDARLITMEIAERISHLKTRVIRLAYDNSRDRHQVQRAITLLSKAGVQKRKIVIYTLFNYTDTPNDFLRRVKDLLEWGVVSYPMRYEPLCVLVKNMFVSPKWKAEWLNLVQRARRVIGYAGTFPPYAPLIEKLNTSEELEEAFRLRPSLEEIKSKLSVGEKEKAQLVYAYYRMHDLTASEVSFKMALSEAEKEKSELFLILNKKQNKKKQKRLGGNPDWRFIHR